MEYVIAIGLALVVLIMLRGGPRKFKERYLGKKD